MANVSAGRDDKRREGVLISVDAGLTNTIYAGTLVTVDASGNAKAGEANTPFIGVAMEGTGDVEGTKIRVWTEGTFEFNITSVAATDLGKTVKVGDDNTVALADENTANNQVVGKIVEVVDTTNGKVRVKI